jgi:D-inositol-3-phosphate glycosyltransferase
MKIALVADHAAPMRRRPATGLSGDQIRTRELSSKLAATGHQVTIYTANHSPDRPISSQLGNGVHVEQLGPPVTSMKELLGGMSAFSATLRERWLKESPDVVHALRWTGGLAALAAARGLGVPVIQTFPSLGVAERRHRIDPGTAGTERIRLEPAIGRTADVVVAANSGDATDLARLGVPRRQIRVIPCGVDTDRYAPEGPAAERNGRPRLVTVTELTQDRALGTLLRALAWVPEAELIVAGGPERAKLKEDKAYRGLAELAGVLGVADRVTFTGRADEDDLPPLLRSADLYVNMSEYEPTGMIALDAMACGTPVITSAAGAPADAIEDGTTGILVPPGRPALLAHRIRQLLARPMMLEALGVAAADRARSRYSWDRIARETLAVYELELTAAA